MQKAQNLKKNFEKVAGNPLTYIRVKGNFPLLIFRKDVYYKKSQMDSVADDKGLYYKYLCKSVISLFGIKIPLNNLN